MRTVYVLQHTPVETLGTIADALPPDVQARYVRSFAGEAVPRSLDGAAGLIVMGGPMGVYEADRYPFLADELRLIETAVRDRKPVLGVCLGSQLIAAALGAEVKKGPEKEIGWYAIDLTDAGVGDPVWRDTPRRFIAFVWHGDIFDVPAGARSLAASALTSCQAFRYGESVYGVLFHMEVTETIVADMTTAFADELAAAGIAGDSVRHGITAHLRPLQQIGAPIFSRWGRLL
jgi:GMP synthase (glutamine-hydrolysing)